MSRLCSAYFLFLSLTIALGLSAQEDSATGGREMNFQLGAAEEDSKDTDFELAQQYYNNQEYERALDYLEDVLEKGVNLKAYNMAFDIYI